MGRPHGAPVPQPVPEMESWVLGESISDDVSLPQAGHAFPHSDRARPGRDSGVKSLEIVNIVRAWRAVGTARTGRALVLRVAEEGLRAGEVNFFSIDGPVAERPRLRLTYVPRRGFGLP